MSPPEDPASERRRFKSMDRMELVSEWEQPMPAGTRELLQAELERRSYRIKSLPTPPPPPTGDEIAAPVDPEEVASERRRDVMAGSATWLFVLGILHLLGSAFAFFGLVQDGAYDGGASLEDSTRVVVAIILPAIPAVIGFAFVALHGLARKRPYPALPIGFGLFLALVACELVLAVLFRDPADTTLRIAIRLPLRVLALLALGNGARASLIWRDERRAGAAPLDPLATLP